MIVLRLHAGDGGEHRHRWLAHRQHVYVATEQMQHRDQVIDVVVEIEGTLRQRHHARVHPFGEIDVVVGQKALDCAAQQSWIVARHRRDDEQARLWAARQVLERALEMQEPAERPLPHAVDVDRHPLAAHQRRGDAPFGPAVAAGRALEQLESGRGGLAERGVRPRVRGVLEEQPAGVSEGAGRIERRQAHLVEPVGRRGEHRARRGEHRVARIRDGCAAEFPNCHGPGPQPRFLQCSTLSSFCHVVNLAERFIHPVNH